MTVRPRIPAGPMRSAPLLAVLLVAALLYFAAPVLIPIAAAMLLTFLLATPVRRLERLRVPRVVAVAGVMVGSTLVLGVIGWVVERQAVEFVSNLPGYKNNIQEKLKDLRPSRGGLLARAERTLDELEKELRKPEKAEPAVGGTTGAPEPEPVPVRVVERPTPTLTYARQVLGPIIRPLFALGIVLVFTFFMLLQREDLRSRFLRLAGNRDMPMTTHALDEAGQRVSRYLLMQTATNAIAGATVGIGLFILGVPGAALWGALTMVMRFIPYVGMWLAAALPLGVVFAVFPGWAHTLGVLAIVGGVEVICGNFVEPWLVGPRTGLSPVAVLAAAMFWAWLWGPVGLLLATPLTVCLVVLGRYVPALAFLEVVLGDEPVLPPAVRLYQRLLAGDQDEASKLVEGYAEGASLAGLYDGLLLASLRLAEQDRHRGNLDATHERLVREILGVLAEDADARVRATEAEVMAVSDPMPGEVLCVPARDEADGLASAMLARVLRRMGIDAQEMMAGTSSGEVIERVVQRPPLAVVISAVPPSASLHARLVLKRLSARFPELRIFVGVWDSEADPQLMREKIGASNTDQMVTTMAQAALRLRGLNVQETAVNAGVVSGEAREAGVTGGVLAT